MTSPSLAAMSVLSRKLLLSESTGCHDCAVLTVDGGRFVVHRAFLSVTSPFFAAAFCAEYGSQRELLLKEVSASVLGILLGYYYEHKLNINNDNVEEVLIAADMLLMDEARNLCLDHMLQNMDVDNCLSLAELTQWYHWPAFREAVFSYIHENFDMVWRNSSEFPIASAALLAQLFSSDELNVREETDLLYAVYRWYTQVSTPTTERAAGLLTLLQCARVGLCTEPQLGEFQHVNPILARNSAYQTAVYEALWRGPCVCNPQILRLLHCGGAGLKAREALESKFQGVAALSGSTASRTSKSSYAAEPPQFPCARCACSDPERWVPRMPHEMLFMVGGWGSGESRDVVEAYDPRACRWLTHKKYSTTPRVYHGAVLVGKHVYVVGGMQGGVYLNSCDRFDTERCVWEPCSPMDMARGYVAVTALDNYVYAIGGRDDFSRTASVERYNPVSNQWTKVSDMKTVRSGGSACAFRGKLYASGGFDGYSFVSSVEEYTPSSNSWWLVPRMPSPRAGHHMVAMAGRIYILGGYNGHGRLNTMIASKMDKTLLFWEKMSPMTVGRSTFAVAQLYGELYIIGGYTGTCDIASVECYSPVTNTWRPGVPLNEPVRAMAGCYVKSLTLARRLAARGALVLSS